MELNIKVSVQTPADVLRYGRSGALPMDLAARTCLAMVGWKDREIDAVVPKSGSAQGSKKIGRPSGYEARRDEVKALVEAGRSVAEIASGLKVSIPTARAWVNRFVAEQPQPQMHHPLQAMLTENVA